MRDANSHADHERLTMESDGLHPVVQLCILLREASDMCHGLGISPIAQSIEQLNQNFELDIPPDDFVGIDSPYFVHFFESDWAAVIDRRTNCEYWYDQVNDTKWALSGIHNAALY